MIILPVLPTLSLPANPLVWPEHGCADRRGRHIKQYPHKGEVLAEKIGEKEKWTIIKCETCSFSHLLPLPCREYLAEYYKKKFYQESHPEYVTNYEADMEWWSMKHERTMRYAMEFADERGTVLDVGCGPGLFLDEALRYGWKTYGLELDAAMVARCTKRGHRVSNYEVEDDAIHRMPAFRESFDFVEMYEVLEHMVDPESSLLAVNGMMKKNGLLHVVVPNDFSPLQLMACKQHDLDPWWIAPPEHLNYFSPATLQLLLRRCGFSPFIVTGSFPIEVFMVPYVEEITCKPSQPILYVGDHVKGRQCHHARVKWELEYYKSGNIGLLEDLYMTLMNEQRIGRETSIFAWKT